MNRRDFCLSTTSGLGLAALGAPSWAAPLPEEPLRPIAAVIYDERYEDAREFAASLESLGAIAFPVNGDSGRAWYGGLARLMARRGGRVAGMSTYADLVIAKACGREIGLRPVYEGTHDARRPGQVAHRYRILGAGQATLGRAARLPGRLAEILLRIGDAGAEAWTTVEAPGVRRDGQPGYSTSWLLAPRIFHR